MTLSVIRKSTSVILAMAFAASAVGCDESDVAIGAGLIGIGAGIIAIDKANDHDHRRRHRDDSWRRKPRRNKCRSHYERECVTYRDRWGYKKRDCRRVERRRCNGFYAMSLAAGNSSEPMISETTQQWANAFKLSYDGADKVIGALEKSHKGDALALQELGLQKSDLLSLAQFKMISDEGLLSLSENLNQHIDDTESMVATIIDNGKGQAKDPSSYLWQACVGSGHWKTPENASCKKASWPGCSVDTGATMCVPKM